MSQALQAIQITQSIYWVGAIDWSLRDFHGYETRRGSTYNAFLVKGNSGYILIDTVKRGFEHELEARISSICHLKDIKAIISNHAEMDHSGNLPYILHRIGSDVPVYASMMGVKALAAHFGDNVKAIAVKNGSSLEIDGRTFKFVETRMLHWPDSMWTFDEKEHVLFSNDAFGMHLATLERWYDECDPAILKEEGERYFANILMPYAPLVSKLCASYDSLGIDVAVLCPDHGPLWRNEGIQLVLNRYAEWSNKSRPRKKAVVVFDTMWHSTESMAHAIAEGIHSSGCACTLLPLSGSHRSDVAAALIHADALIVGSPTLNSGMLPKVADVLCYLAGLKFPIKLGAAFGSYGWAPLGPKAVAEQLKSLCLETLEPQTANFVPTPEDLEACRNYGKSIGDKMMSE